MSALTFFATTAKGMEELLATEISALKGVSEVSKVRAGVSFRGDLESGYRACLWSRIANRILLPLKTISAPTPEKLYGGVKSIRWSDHLSPKDTLAVDFSSSDSKITHTHFGALKVKDAIVDQFRSTQGSRPSVDPLRPSVRINVYVFKDEATISIDLSGESLHRRGYREEQTYARAPLKENLASAILSLANWKEESAKGNFLLDPMCGTATLPIEAAMIAANIAPGLHRKYFGFMGWKKHDASIWKKLIDEAKGLQVKPSKRFPKIVGYDRDFRAVRGAIENVERAGLRGMVHIEKREWKDCEKLGESGIVVINPPYGERLGEIEELKPLYKSLGDGFKQRFKGCRGYIFTGSPDLAKTIGLKAARRFILFNGAIECRLFKFDLY